MSDLRFDPIFGQWVSIAKNRNDRPIEFVPMEKVVKRLICPFCSGSEHETPNAWATYLADGTMHRGNHTDPWIVRVIPNKYPSFSQFDQATQSTSNDSTVPEFDEIEYTKSYAESGIQDLIIPSPRHVISLSDLTDQEIKLCFRAFQDRLICLREHPAIKHAMLFTNCRSAAGASLEHIHSQLIGVPLVSAYLRDRVRRCEEHYQMHKKSLMESLSIWECEIGERVIDQTDNFTAYCPFASRFPFQIRIAPTKVDCFLDCSESERNELAILSQKLIKALEVTLDDPSYNMLFQIPPFVSRKVSQQWSLELFPRMTIPAGFELGTDIWVNPVAPEVGARRLRATLANLGTK